MVFVWLQYQLTCPYNVYPITPNFHIVKFGVTGFFVVVFFTYFSYFPAQWDYNMGIDRFPTG